MKKQLLLTIAIILLTTYLAVSEIPNRSGQTDTSPEDYAVYAVVIRNMFGDAPATQSKTKLLVIGDHTTSDRISWDGSDKARPYLKRMFPEISPAIANDYRSKNKESVRLRDSFDLKMKRVLVAKQELSGLFERGLGRGWEEFYKRYPESGGFISLSRVGFNSQMNQALVYVAHSCGGLCGTGHYLLLNKDAQGWRESRRVMAWIS